MIRRLLVADRGEIARRVFATCRLVGIETVAVYSAADSDAPHVGEADYAVRLDGETPGVRYLRGDLIITAAQRTGANAIHPGNGLLAEDPDFAAAVVDAGMIWVGAPAKTLGMLRSKSETKALVAEARVPVLPTFTDPAEVPGYPVLIKPDAGRGGAGMRVVRDAATLAEAIATTRREAGGDGLLRAVRRGRPAHRDPDPGRRARLGGAVRRARVLDPAPLPEDHRGDAVPAVDPGLREELCRAAIVAVRAIGYVGAGAVEFLLDADGDFWFLELTPTLQAEHAVTECVSGYDLVRLQLLVAEGGSLPMPGPPPIRGHAIEVRICAEDPAYAWLPATGTLHRFARARRGRRVPPAAPARPAAGRRGGGRLGDRRAPGLHPGQADRLGADPAGGGPDAGLGPDPHPVARRRHQPGPAGPGAAAPLVPDRGRGHRLPGPAARGLRAAAVRGGRGAHLLPGRGAGRRGLPPGRRHRARLAALGLAQRPVRLADRGVRRPGRPGRGGLPDEPARRAGRLVGTRGRPGGARPGRPGGPGRRWWTTTRRPWWWRPATSRWCWTSTASG